MRAATMLAVATHTIRFFGDPVLKRPTAEVTDIDGGLVKLVDAMYETMHEANGVGLAAPQVGVQKRFFVYEIPDETGPHVLLNPQIVEATGEWLYEEGCLSLPGLRSRSCAQARDGEGHRPRRQRGRRSRATSCSAASSCTRPTISTACSCSTGSIADQRKLAMRELREQGMGVRTPGGRTPRALLNRSPNVAPVRIVFLGTPADAVPPLRALVADGHDVALVVTQPDRRRIARRGHRSRRR